METNTHQSFLALNPSITKQIDLPPFGFVELLDHYGSDARIVAAARISYDSEGKGEEQDKKLLFYLYKNRHTSPFEQCNVTFRIKFPIFLMRQFVRHRTFRLNEWSGRYSELADEFFIPQSWRAQDTQNKQAGVKALEDQSWCSRVAAACYTDCYRTYRLLLKQGVSKEQARFVLPVSIYTKIVVNIDLHNLMHFFRLRLDSHAQSEMRDVAQAMFDLVAPLYPWTFEAYLQYSK